MRKKKKTCVHAYISIERPTEMFAEALGRNTNFDMGIRVYKRKPLFDSFSFWLFSAVDGREISDDF